MKEQINFNLKTCPNFKFRFMRLPATELVALQTQLNFDEFDKAIFSVAYILEHTEVEAAGQWMPVKEKGREVYNPEAMNDNVAAMNEILTLFLTTVIAPVFQKSNG